MPCVRSGNGRSYDKRGSGSNGSKHPWRKTISSGKAPLPWLFPPRLLLLCLPPVGGGCRLLPDPLPRSPHQAPQAPQLPAPPCKTRDRRKWWQPQRPVSCRPSLREQPRSLVQAVCSERSHRQRLRAPVVALTQLRRRPGNARTSATAIE